MDFAFFLLTACLAGEIVAEDIIVLDNASIHYARECADIIDYTCQLFDFTLLFLPNPCETCFAFVKNHRRTTASPCHLRGVRHGNTRNDRKLVQA